MPIKPSRPIYLLRIPDTDHRPRLSTKGLKWKAIQEKKKRKENILIFSFYGTAGDNKNFVPNYLKFAIFAFGKQANI